MTPNPNSINPQYGHHSRPWWLGQVTGLSDERCAATKL